MKVSQLKKNPNNPRQIKGEKLELLKKSVGSFQKMMSLRPIIVDENNVVLGGNMRLAAIKALGLKEIPDEWVKKADDLSEDEKREFVIKDNAGFGEWDWDVLANEWDSAELTEWGLDLPDFQTIDPAEIGNADAEPQMDKAAELNKKWKVKAGDLWRIGEHRLLCGSSAAPEDVSRLIDGITIDLMTTDPPYGVGYEYDNHDDSDNDAYWDLMTGFMHARPDSPALITVGHKHNNEWFRRFDPHSFLIWFDNTKQSPHKVAYMCKSELILTFGKLTDRYAWDTFEVRGVRGDGLRELHTCPKPVELFQKLIEPQKDAKHIYEPFCGSGTTMVACQNLGRKCYALELSENYCAVILERMATAFPGIEIERG